ncbi:MAG TPA: flavin reductase family protein [Rhodospirillaceae bacterium]|nr:flavin reductase family protein [Rhodospirillaceae bacterium]
MSVDSQTFRKALGCFPTGVTVVTATAADGSPLGVTISSFTSLSLEPPLVLFCLDNKNLWLDSFAKAGFFAVNVLALDQRALSERFAGRAEDKWIGIAHEPGHGGVPVIAGSLAVLECSLEAVHPGGDHQIFVGRVQQLRVAPAGRPLVHFRGAYGEIKV